MTSSNGLPQGWDKTTINELAEIVTKGSSPNWQGFDYTSEGIVFVRSQNVGWGKLDLSDVAYLPQSFNEKEKKSVLKANDVLVNIVGASIGRIALANPAVEGGNVNQAVSVVRLFKSAFLPQLLVQYLLSPEAQARIHFEKVDVARANVSLEDIKSFPVPFPPLAEQRRIVAKIEELFTKLDAGVASLKAAKKQLKRYRQSVLKAAVEGELTREWRENHKEELEPASVLLERILKERRAKWEADQLAKMQAQGKPPKDDKWKAKYQEPDAPKISTLPKIPPNWTWGTFQQVSNRVTVGFVGPMKDEYVSTGIPFLRGQNVRENRYDPNGLKFISQQFHERIIKSKLLPNDLVVVRSGSVGVACVIPESFEEANCSDLVIVQQPRAIQPHFGAYYMNSTARSRVTSEQVGMALTHFNTQSMAEMPVPIPPMAEQQQIVAEVERRLSVTDGIEATLDAELKRAERLRQSILKRAFEGKLVPQDPNDEPASTLLERIRAERAQLHTNEKKSGRKKH